MRNNSIFNSVSSYLLKLGLLSIILIFISCKNGTQETCKARNPEVVKEVSINWDNFSCKEEFQIYQNDEYEYCKTWFRIGCYENLIELLNSKLNEKINPYNVVIYIKGLLSNTDKIYRDDIYAISVYLYNSFNKTLRMRTFMKDSLHNNYKEIKELDSYISGWIVNYIDRIANELIPELFRQKKSAINIYSFEMAKENPEPRILMKLSDDNFFKKIEEYKIKIK